MTFTPSELARRLGTDPRSITMLFYERAIPDAAAPIQNGKRRIPETLEPEIRAKLLERGKLLEQPTTPA